MRKLKYAVVGAGAVGSAIGAVLALGGAEVWFVDPFEAHMKAIEEHGLKVAKGSYMSPMEFTDIVVPVKTATTPEPVGKADVIIFLVKGNYSESAIPTVKALFKEDSTIITLQNGIGNVEILEKYFSKENIGYGVTTISSSVVEPGSIRTLFPPAHDLYIGADVPGTSERIEMICEDFRKGGSDCNYAPDVLKRMWTKAAMNCSGNALMGILRLNARRAGAFDSYVYLNRKLLEEIYAVAAAKGIELDRDEIGMSRPVMPYETSTLPDNYASTAQDIMHHKKTEIDFLNGAIVREGQAVGVPTPFNEAIARIVDVLEKSYDWQF